MDVNSSSDDYLPSPAFFISLVLLLSFCIIIGITGNLAVIFYNIFLIKSRTPTAFFVVNLSISDIIVCCAFYPSRLIEFTNILSGHESNHRIICKIGVASSGTSAALSVANLLAITYDRYIYISWPLKCPMIMTWWRTCITVITTWLLAVLNGNLLFWYAESGQRRLYCQMHPLVFNVYSILNLYLPSACLLVLNYKIFKVAKTQMTKIITPCYSNTENSTASANAHALVQNHRFGLLKRQVRLVKTFVILVCLFLLSIIPFTITAKVEVFICRTYCVQTTWYIIANLLLGINSFLNPYIYGARNKELKIAFRQFFSRQIGTI